jgi:hypothetical protein
VPQILAATSEGLHRFDSSGGSHRVEHAGRDVTFVAPEGWELWALLDHRELVHTAGVDWWFHVADFKGFKGECIADTRAGVIVGSSRAHLFRVAGEGLERVTSFDNAEGREEWFTPWGGPPDTRSLTEDGDTVYVNVHVGGVLLSSDHGDSWAPTIDIGADIHQVTTGHGRVYAAGAEGLHVSTDKGKTWSQSRQGLHAAYCRAVTVCGDAVLMSASTGPGGGRSALYRGGIDGKSFERCSGGLPGWFKDNIDTYCLDALPDGKLAAFGTKDGSLFGSTDQGGTWSEVTSGLPLIQRVLIIR